METQKKEALFKATVIREGFVEEGSSELGLGGQEEHESSHESRKFYVSVAVRSTLLVCLNVPKRSGRK
jgi:hypothetical protein